MKLLLSTILVTFLFACNSSSQDNGDGKKKSPKPESEKKVSKRDLSITAANAYNDIFIDSTDLLNYFKETNANDTIVRRMTSFYNARNYQYAWFSKEGLTEQARGFWNLHNYQTVHAGDSTLADKELKKTMDNLITEERLNIDPKSKKFKTTEFKLTEDFITYMLNNVEDGYVKRKEMERFVPRKKEDPMYLADSLLTKKHKDDKYYEQVNESYGRLKIALKHYYDVAKAGGWPEITAKAKSFKKGTSSPDVKLLKRRLQLSGDLPVNDTSMVFNDTLENAIKSFQARFGYTADGKLTDMQLKDMNVSAVDRVKQILVNMGRMTWMINEPKGRLIMVNIPEFVLHVKDQSKDIFTMDVVVGKEGHSTMMFTGNLNQVVFSPYWNIPPSIVRNEILPAVDRNPGYLASQNMEVTSSGGDLPSIRQRPGPGNALGKVKFLFPNSFNIYFHDTPAKSLFKKDKRAFSHGCIRLSEPKKMAEYLLQGKPEWTSERIDAAMNSGSEKYVKLDNPVPVLITYYTAWVDDNGKLHFREDIYDHDKKVMAKMFP